MNNMCQLCLDIVRMIKKHLECILKNEKLIHIDARLYGRDVFYRIVLKRMSIHICDFILIMTTSIDFGREKKNTSGKQ